MKLNFIHLLAFSSLLGLSSCFGDDGFNDYSEWREKNIQYITTAEQETIDGVKKYEKIVPPWQNSIFTLVHWHNDRELTKNNLSPLSNSTVDIKYLLKNIEGDTLDSSASMTKYGDGIYRCRPCNMITGFWVTLTNMHVGDSVTTIVPADAGYGITGSGSVLPYSTLIFELKLDSIVAYESVPWR